MLLLSFAACCLAHSCSDSSCCVLQQFVCLSVDFACSNICLMHMCIHTHIPLAYKCLCLYVCLHWVTLEWQYVPSTDALFLLLHSSSYMHLCVCTSNSSRSAIVIDIFWKWMLWLQQVFYLNRSTCYWLLWLIVGYRMQFALSLAVIAYDICMCVWMYMYVVGRMGVFISR